MRTEGPLPTEKFTKKVLGTIHTKKRRRMGREETMKNGKFNAKLRKQFCRVFLGLVDNPNIEVYFCDEDRLFLTGSEEVCGKKGDIGRKGVKSEYVSIYAVLSPKGRCLFKTMRHVKGEENLEEVV